MWVNLDAPNRFRQNILQVDLLQNKRVDLQMRRVSKTLHLAVELVLHLKRAQGGWFL
jgi:hypothetical protein